VRPRIAEVIYNPAKVIDLRKQISFDPDAGFSIEDPLFRYYLSYLDTTQFIRELGIGDEAIERTRLYAYDVGFSFAGEVRQIAETINNELKIEDVITFYDFDLQAFLLAHDLENTLRRVYAESCRFYLVFLDKHYREKVWTKYEKDIMTGSKRKEHIIPVILDEIGAEGAVGISSTIGRIDLRDLWNETQRSGTVGLEIVHAIRNRCVLPLLEKLDSITDTV
jgi:hypothetical protein